ncbi:MAG: 50S ribosomal protein L25 [Bacteroidales bacterium]
MKHIELKGQAREAGNKAVVKAFRRQGLVPCNLYGNGSENVLFTVTAKDLKTVTDTPNAYIVDIVLDNGKKYTAVAHEFQYHPLSDICLHGDFLSVGEDKPIAITVPVSVTGHAVGVQNGGKFFLITRELRISALMKDLPDSLLVDVTNLQIEKQMRVSELHYDNVTILSSKNTIVCAVKSTRQLAAQAAKEVAIEESALGTPAPAETAAAAPAADATADAAAATDAAAPASK